MNEPSILIIQEHLPAFRVGFYEHLRSSLLLEGVSMNLAYAPNQRNAFQRGEIEWATPVPLRQLPGRLCWQGVLKYCQGTSLVVIQQETKYMINPVLQAWRRIGGPLVAYWGHGRNLQAENPNSCEERVKRWLSTRVDWWFAYNRMSAEIVRSAGFPSDRITTVMNSIDTRLIRNVADSTTGEQLSDLKNKLGIRSDQVAVYTGGLYHLKRLGFLIDACDLIHRQIQDFHLILIGSGPDEGLVMDACASRPWLHYEGPKSDAEKVPYWMISKLLLMPGGVGLVILDSFALGVPMVTTDTRLHGPEIDYLKDGRNGLLIECGESVETYADSVVGLLQDEARHDRLRQGAQASAADYSIEKMARNFATGVMKALDAPRI